MLSAAIPKPAFAALLDVKEVRPFLTPQDLEAYGLLTVLTYAYIFTIRYLSTNNVIESKLARKLIHIAAGPGFLLSWLLFSGSIGAQYLAATLPFFFGLQAFLISNGTVKDSEKFSVVKSMSRGGDRSELAKGPLIYSLVMICSALFGWRNSPETLVAICALCVGDGLADPIGRKFGKHKLYSGGTWGPFSLPGSKKSWEGSIFGMFLGSWLSSWGFLALFAHFGFISALVVNPIKLAVIALACTIAEACPEPEIDNFTIPLTAIVGTKLLL